jgi:hypothetical protein
MTTLRSLPYVAVFRSPGLRAIVAAHAISMFGTVAADAALSLLVYRETKSGLLAALAFSFAFIPQAVSGPLLGGSAGRCRTRTILVGANVASAVLAAGMAAPRIPAGGQLALAAVLGAIAPLHNGARAAMLLDALDHETFLAARSVLRILSQFAVVFGFTCGGALSVVAGPRAVLLGNAGSFLLAALLLWRATAGATGPAPADPVRARARDVLRMFREPALRLTTLRMWLPTAFAAAGTGLTVPYAAEIGQDGPAVGLLLAAFAGGAIIGEIAWSRVPATARRGMAAPMMLLTQLPTVGFVAAPPLCAAIGLRFISGSGFAYLQGTDADIAQLAGHQTRRQVMVVLSSGVMACQGVAMAVAGAIAQTAKPAMVIAGSGAAGAVACMAMEVTWRP